MNENKSYRMYGLVPYNISTIQKGIQFGHALQEYNNTVTKICRLKDAKANYIIDSFYEWANNDKTIILLNGGTTNDNKDSEYFGTMNQHLLWLHENGVECSWFCEPDLGNQLTAIVFLVDCRVWNKKKYPNFSDYCKLQEQAKPENLILEEHNLRKDWLKSVGGEQNAKLKEWLTQFKLA